MKLKINNLRCYIHWIDRKGFSTPSWGKRSLHPLTHRKLFSRFHVIAPYIPSQCNYFLIFTIKFEKTLFAIYNDTLLTFLQLTFSERCSVCMSYFSGEEIQIIIWANFLHCFFLQPSGCLMSFVETIVFVDTNMFKGIINFWNIPQYKYFQFSIYLYDILLFNVLYFRIPIPVYKNFSHSEVVCIDIFCE